MTKRQHHPERKITIRSVRRNPPDMSKLGRALIALAMAQAEAEAEAEAQANAPASEDAPAAPSQEDAS
ncbi:MAG: hypothetical protein ACYC33_06970 [Thermoleophilia bacterium]